MNTTKLLLLSVLLMPLIACGKRATDVSAARNESAKQGDSSGDSVAVPEFAIAVMLSPAADKRLHSNGESINVHAWFEGDSLPGKGKYNSPSRDVDLASATRTVDANNVARFSGLSFPRKDWNRLADKDYYVNINAFSARKADKDNLLDCKDPLDEKISSFRGKTIQVRCWLIGEPDAPVTHP